MLNLDLQFFAVGDFVEDPSANPAPDNFFLYNGEEIFFAAGDTITLHCAGKKMKTDLSVYFTSDGTVTYNGTEIAVALGQRIVLSCAGKKMKSDIVIAVPEPASTYNITHYAFGCTWYSTNATEIDEGESVTLQFALHEGYSFPTNIYVTGADYVWMPSMGAVEISNPTGAVYVSVTCIEKG